MSMITLDELRELKKEQTEIDKLFNEKSCIYHFYEELEFMNNNIEKQNHNHPFGFYWTDDPVPFKMFELNGSTHYKELVKNIVYLTKVELEKRYELIQIELENHAKDFLNGKSSGD